MLDVVGGTAVICMRGELDMATASELGDLLDGARATRASTVLLDLGEVSFIDAYTVGVIVSAWAAARRRGQRLRVVGLAAQPARVFEILGLRRLLMPVGPDAGPTGRTR